MTPSEAKESRIASAEEGEPRLSPRSESPATEPAASRLRGSATALAPLGGGKAPQGPRGEADVPAASA